MEKKKEKKKEKAARTECTESRSFTERRWWRRSDERLTLSCRI